MAERWTWPVAFVVCLAAALVPLWSVTYVPMVDLGQHAWQLYLWEHHDDPAYRGLYEVNWFTPYLLGYGLVRPLARVFGILAALKLVLSATVAGLALATDFLLRTVHGSRWFALFAFPLAYGYSFYWGFLNFLVAVPLGVLVLALMLRDARRPARARAGTIAALALLLFFAHVLAVAVVFLAGLALVAGEQPWRGDRRGAWRTTVRAALPFAPLAALVLVWTIGRAFGPHAMPHDVRWDGSPLTHVYDLPQILLGLDDVQTGRFAALVALVLALAGVRFARRPAVAWGAGVAAGLWLAFPDALLGAALLRDRFAVVAALLALGTLRLPVTPRRRAAAALALVLAVLVWSGATTYRFRFFDREARALDPLLERMPPGQRVLKLVFDPAVRGLPGRPLLLHQPMWYHARKGGLPGYEFARYPHLLFRYTRRPPVGVGPGIDWSPERMLLWAKTVPEFDYVIVYSKDGSGAALVEHVAPAVPVARSGRWTLLRTTRAEDERIATVAP